MGFAQKNRVSRRNTPQGESDRSVEGQYFFKVPDISDETLQAIHKAKAYAAFFGVCRLLRDQARRGKTATIRDAATHGTLGTGFRAVAKSCGADVKTIRSQFKRLEAIGLCVIRRQPCLTIHDQATGKIVGKRFGRTPPVLITLTITEEHLRPRRKTKPAGLKVVGTGESCPPSPADSKGKFSAPSRERYFHRSESTPGSGEPAGRVSPGAAVPPPVTVDVKGDTVSVRSPEPAADPAKKRWWRDDAQQNLSDREYADWKAQRQEQPHAAESPQEPAGYGDIGDAIKAIRKASAAARKEDFRTAWRMEMQGDAPPETANDLAVVEHRRSAVMNALRAAKGSPDGTAYQREREVDREALRLDDAIREKKFSYR